MSGMRVSNWPALAGLLAAAAPLPPAWAADPVVAYTITDASEIPESLTGAAGDPERGRAIYASEPRAGCHVCHGIPASTGGAPQGPELTGVGARLTAGAIRLWIVAAEVLRPDTPMPAFYAAGQRTGADDPLYGGPALTAAEIEDLVAYLSAETGPG